jgi:uridine kinase
MVENASSQIITVAQLSSAALAAPRKLGSTCLILIDGPAGSGKTTMAEMLKAELNAQVVHMDDLYHGWEDALTTQTMSRIMTQLLQPLLAHKSGSYRKYDWVNSKLGELIWIEPGVVIIEGVGSASSLIRDYASLVIWLEVEPDLGLSRVLARDGNQISEEMKKWQATERAWHFKDETRQHSDVLLSGVRTADLASWEYLTLTK